MIKNILFAGMFSLALLPVPLLADGYAVLPHESISELVLLSSDPNSSSFIVKNMNGDHVTGYADDYLGLEEGRVIEITQHHISVETIEIVKDKDGRQREQPSHMRIPISFSFFGRGMGMITGEKP